MIEEPTVFVLGAGASHPYGMPLAVGLKEAIVEGWGDYHTPHSIAGKVLNAGFTPEQGERFRSQLQGSHLTSVDAFLSHRVGSDFHRLGVVAMAAALLDAEKEAATQLTGDWYPKLIKLLNAPVRRFALNAINVVSFNYDRTLEAFLLGAIANLFDCSPDDANGFLRTLRVSHLYGDLGDLHAVPLGGPETGVEYDRFTCARDAASRIRVLDNDDLKVTFDTEFQRARLALKDATRIVFLGFGFDRTNLGRLMAGILENTTPGAEIWASATGLTRRTRDAINGQVGHKSINFVDGTCLDTIGEIWPY